MNNEQKDKKEEKVTIPDQLNITINTSIPGFQKIEYNPSMTIKDTSEKTVQFDPLFKLEQSTINRIPPEYKVKQFFNKGLFMSLKNATGGTPAKSLQQAMRNGYINNNIKITLDNIFPVNSVIYINKKPYAIGDVQWTTGDWKLDLKHKRQEIDPSKVTDPYLYSQLVKDEIISGEEQLNQMPKELLTGNNYRGPPVAKGLTNVKEEKKEEPIKEEKQNIPPPKPETPKQITDNSSIKSEPPKQITDIAPPKPPKPITDVTLPKQITDTTYDNKKLLPPSEPKVEELSPENEKIFDVFNSNLKTSVNSTLFFRKYFVRKQYYFLANSIVNKLTQKNKQNIRDFYQIVTQSKPTNATNLSQTMYNKLCDQVSIVNTIADGDCFFQAVSDGINIYNYENQLNKITMANYGKSQLFTVSVIRDIVLRYIEDIDQNELQTMLELSEMNVENLNGLFSDFIRENPSVSQEDYMAKLNYIYSMNDSFLVYKPLSIPVNINEYDKPFRVLTKQEIPRYIKSKNYWANSLAIKAVCKMLGIYVVPIEKYKTNNNSTMLRTYLIDPNNIKGICSKRVMFLYYRDNHYELIRFKYLKQITKTVGVNKSLEVIPKWYSIFDLNGLPPPYHILILLYGSSYSKLDELSKSQFQLYPSIMKNLDMAVKANMTTMNFIEIFDKEFPSNKLIKTMFPENNQMIGGQSQNLYQPPPNIIYNNYYRPYTKKPEDSGTPKIAYSISIDMELHPGTMLTAKQISDSKCNSKYNAIRKSFAEFTGKPYVIPPVYSGGTTRKNKNIRNKTNKKY